MAGERVKLQVLERDSRGTRESRRLRKQGLIPGVLYGRGKEPHAFCVAERELRRALTGDGGLHAILDVTGMAIGDTLRLVDLPVQEGVKFLDDPEETVLATVTMPTKFVEPEPEEVEGEEELEEGEVPEGEEAPEGEEGAEPAAEGEGEEAPPEEAPEG